MRRLSADWLAAPETQAVCAMLTDAGHRALFVGGCVRDTLIGKAVGDIDISTDATPETVMNLARKARLRPVPTGIDHGTVTIVSGGFAHEVTTFRRDVETDGRRAVVAFTGDVAEDARRRDFTMNALYAEPDGSLVDPLGGLADLNARRVRFIEDPDARIREDYLRILRFFRFHAWYGDETQGLDAEGLAACAANSAGIETLSRERVGAEMRKLLAAPDPAPAVASMAATGCLARILPGADARALPVLVALEDVVTADPIRRLAALGGDDPAEALRLSKADARRLDEMARAARADSSAAELGYRMGAAGAMDALMVRFALLAQPLPDETADQVAQGAAARFPLKAADLMPRYQGAALGRTLRKAEARWIASGFTMSKEDLLR